eukprot:TRINITY_DN31589_c0_g1_i3.p1 TRINITY_DN31589_c0_g1~~TRINITY_DN31589_c0_g1_i3.p1  ORF type:complete len:1004 (+),score=125.79 TRINITY_DN31589_c0_g1_i3:115-3126(+)
MRNGSLLGSQPSSYTFRDLIHQQLSLTQMLLHCHDSIVASLQEQQQSTLGGVGGDTSSLHIAEAGGVSSPVQQGQPPSPMSPVSPASPASPASRADVSASGSTTEAGKAEEGSPQWQSEALGDPWRRIPGRPSWNMVKRQSLRSVLSGRSVETCTESARSPESESRCSFQLDAAADRPSLKPSEHETRLPCLLEGNLSEAKPMRLFQQLLPPLPAIPQGALEADGERPEQPERNSPRLERSLTFSSMPEVEAMNNTFASAGTLSLDVPSDEQGQSFASILPRRATRENDGRRVSRDNEQRNSDDLDSGRMTPIARRTRRAKTALSVMSAMSTPSSPGLPPSRRNRHNGTSEGGSLKLAQQRLMADMARRQRGSLTATGTEMGVTASVTSLVSARRLSKHSGGSNGSSQHSESESEIMQDFVLWPVWQDLSTDLPMQEVSFSTPTLVRMSTGVMRFSAFEDRHATRMLNTEEGLGLRAWLGALAFVFDRPGLRLTAALVSMVVILYDLFAKPLCVFGMREQAFIVWFTQLFWSLKQMVDCTKRKKDVHKHSEDDRPRGCMSRSWTRAVLLFNLVLVAVDWTWSLVTVLCACDEPLVSGFRELVQGLRVARACLSLDHLWKSSAAAYASRWLGRSPSTTLVVGILNHLAGILLINHFIACGWYFLGKATGGWVQTYCQGDTPVMMYFTSLHWSLTQFTPATMAVQPQNFPERMFAVGVLLFALITFSSFVSSIQNLMTNLRNLRSTEARQLGKLDQYLSDHSISVQLSVRLRRYLQRSLRNQQHNLQEKDIELLEQLSTPMYMELRFELHYPLLSKHPFFASYADINQQAVQRICFEALKSTSLCASDSLFSVGDTAWGMYHVAKGVLMYALNPPGHLSPRKGSLDFIGKTAVHADDWFCEPVLWTPWEHKGNMSAITEVDLVVLSAETFHAILQNNRAAAQFPVGYAMEAVCLLNTCDKEELSDLGRKGCIASEVRCLRGSAEGFCEPQARACDLQASKQNATF